MTHTSSSQVAARPGSVILRASEADVAEALLVFQAGFAVGPFSLGQQGDWRVRANGVADLHLYLWFDGLTLYAAKLHGRPDASVNGKPLGEDWCALADSAELRIGEAKIVVSAHSAVAGAELESVQPGSDACAAENELESVQPEPDARAVTTGDVPPPGERPRGLLERLRLVRNRRPTRPAILLFGCLAALLVLWFAIKRPTKVDNKPVHTPRRALPAAESSVRPPPAIEPQPTPSFTSGVEAPPPPGSTLGMDESSVRPRASTTRAMRAALERRAVDAVISGDFQLGADLYEKLSKLAPDSKIFKVARRVSANKATTDPSPL